MAFGISIPKSTLQKLAKPPQAAQAVPAGVQKLANPAQAAGQMAAQAPPMKAVPASTLKKVANQVQAAAKMPPVKAIPASTLQKIASSAQMANVMKKLPGPLKNLAGPLQAAMKSPDLMKKLPGPLKNLAGPLQAAMKSPAALKNLPGALQKLAGPLGAALKSPDLMKSLPGPLKNLAGPLQAAMKSPDALKNLPAAIQKLAGIKPQDLAKKGPAGLAAKPQPPKAPALGAKAPGAAAAKAPAAAGANAPTAKKVAGGGGGGGKGDTETGLNTPKFKIKVGTAPKELPPAAATRISEIVVDQSVEMADMCKIVMRNDDFAISDSPDFKPGSKLEVELGYEEHGAKMTKVFQGEITAIQADFPRRGSMQVRVIAYTEYHRLMRGRHMRAWEKKTYADIATAIASECKLKAATDPTPGQHEYVFQRNQTNLEFLLELAEKVGYEVFASDGKLFFRKPTPEKSKIRTLKKGELLLSFNPKISVSLRPTGVKVLSFDDGQVASVVGEAKDTDAGPAMGGKQVSPKISANIGPAEQVITEQVFRKADDAKALAVATMKEASLDLVRADASAQGSGDLRPGFVVEIQGVGEIFSGPYYITRVVHNFLPSGFSTRLGLKKTSIELAPPSQNPQRGAGQDQSGNAGLATQTGTGPGQGGGAGKKKKPDLKNLKIAVGDKAPDWWKDQDTGLDDAAEIKNLKLSYGKDGGPPAGLAALIAAAFMAIKPELKNLKLGYEPSGEGGPAQPQQVAGQAAAPPKPEIANLRARYESR